MKSEIDEREVDTPDELLARILDAAFCTKEREDLIQTINTRTSQAICLMHRGRRWVFLNICFKL